MSETSNVPRPYEEWATDDQYNRMYDAAYTFGYDLIRYCREEALKVAFKTLPAESEARSVVEESVDIALHNVVDLLEGFFGTKSGSEHSVDYILTVAIRNSNDEYVEKIDISPNLLDLPIGYWKWRDGGFRRG